MSLRIKKHILLPIYFSAITFLFLVSSCKKQDLKDDAAKLQNQKSESADIAVRWADLTLQVIRGAARNSPTYSSRSLGYMGLTMYESVVNMDSTKRSMNNQLNGLSTIPMPQLNAVYYWPLAL